MSTALRAVPISQDWSDAELVAAVRRGDDLAFAELYSRYSHRIGAYVHGMVGDHGRAEDITQEIFIAALRRMRATERPIAFNAWIYEIAKNACIDNFRRSRRTQEVSLDADDRLSSADRGRLTAVTTMDAALDNKQALDDLRGAFGGLSENHHEILVLRELEGRSYSDIGQRLGMSRPVVESTLFRARRRLAEEYEELTSGRRCEFVRKMVDSGPHYSLGIRDRRRMARHFAHCQPCRAHARLVGFDESILNMPSVAARIAAFLPIPLLRTRWGALEHGLGSATPGRPSLLAVRSVHTLARSSDQLVGAGSGAGRGAATAAAIVLAGVGGGIATVSSLPAQDFNRSTVHAIVQRPHGSAAVPPGSAARRIKGSAMGRSASVTSGHRVSASFVKDTGASNESTPAQLIASTTAGAVSPTKGGATAPDASTISTPGSAEDPAGAGTGGTADPATGSTTNPAAPASAAAGLTAPLQAVAGITAATIGAVTGTSTPSAGTAAGSAAAPPAAPTGGSAAQTPPASPPPSTGLAAGALAALPGVAALAGPLATASQSSGLTGQGSAITGALGGTGSATGGGG